METLFNPDTLKTIQARVDALSPSATRQWGKMTVTQMMEHTARALEMAAGKTPSKQALLGKLIGWTVKKRFLGPQPFPKNGPTAPEFIVKDDPAFDETKKRLQALLSEFHSLGERGCDGNVHKFFGPLTGAEWGITQYKHLDHHLRQFGG